MKTLQEYPEDVKYNTLSILGDYDSRAIITALKSRLHENAIVTVYSLYL
jgi:hypothetical protein